jgi:hypothetical protein
MNTNRVLTSFALALVASSLAACGAPASGEGTAGENAASDTSALSAESFAKQVNASVDTVDFDLHVNPKFAACIAEHPGEANNAPAVHVHVQRGELNDQLTLTGWNIKPGLSFDMFTVERSALNAQAAADPAFHGFGLAWYQSDLEADGNGNMSTTIRTILLDQIFGFDTDVNLNPRNTFHVGFWFSDPQDAAACGFDVTKPTPFNGEHKAGPLAMISVPSSGSNLGPLCTSVDWSVSPPRCNP